MGHVVDMIGDNPPTKHQILATLDRAIGDVKEDRRQANKLLILWLNDEDDSYSVGFSNAGMKMSECLALCEAVKLMFLSQMELVTTPD